MAGKSSHEEDYNLQGREFLLLGYEDDKILEFGNDNKTITGFSGDMWLTLAKFLNFSITVAEVSKNTISSLRGEKTSSILMEEMGLLVAHWALGNYAGFDVTDEFYSQGFKIFVRFDRHFKSRWVIDIYSFKVWCAITITVILFTLSSIFIQKWSLLNEYKRHSTNSEHFFHCFGAMCNQGEGITSVHNQNRVFLMSVCTFSWLLFASYSSQVFVVMTQTVEIPPFKNLHGLYHDTDYIIINNVKSMYLYWLRRQEPIVGKLLDEERYRNFESYKEVWAFACLRKNKAAVMQNDRLKVDYDIPCELKPVGERYGFRRTGGGISKNATLKKIINYGLLKLREIGVTKYLKDKWMRKEKLSTRTVSYSPIIFEQISSLLAIYMIGLCLSFIIFGYECVHL
ncbi:hypothetical protein QAD02_016909 [Eretmocerus hayati]|uniref:Uncharacterized protein n=1 Tax=Eretmocerus hayati TaxID=131215 RepID=A0ACC2PCF7_9HYME|nr:hypothetical protein QAD02_016909 [Eretmocerus hayati]